MPTEFAGRLVSVRASYDGKVDALGGIDLELASGTLTALLGPNASGKTSVLRVLAGRLRPSRGRVRVGGEDPGTLSRRLLWSGLGLVPQDVALDGELTGGETLDLFARLQGLSRVERLDRTRELVEVLELGSHLFRPTATWSGGMRRRLHLALGLLHAPPLLLLDEPTVGLDQASREAVWDALLQHRRRGGAVLVATHDLDAVERHADRAVVLEAGRLRAEGPPAELVREHAVPWLVIDTEIDRIAETLPAEGKALEASLAAVEGVRSVRVRDNSLELRGAEVEAAAPLALEIVRRHRRVRSWKVHEADLGAAFRSLTGHAPERPLPEESTSAADREERP